MSAIRSIRELEQDAKAVERKALADFRRNKARELKATMRCNCDLDNWEPEPSTGHSWVCRIHKAAMECKP